MNVKLKNDDHVFLYEYPLKLTKKANLEVKITSTKNVM